MFHSSVMRTIFVLGRRQAGRQAGSTVGISRKTEGILNGSLRKSYMMALRGWKARDPDLVFRTVSSTFFGVVGD